ncbi:type III toxin-antitoxin system ToxN/AbiQ family toxin [Ruminococcus sp.]|uniref:type III toxin-antitoxin system ToxN/AbiQ family toxin n=1 Tax=Ruminococcus sp. TaxID=41978 RepID=UPI0025E5D2B0|nr:type III toxin-antitoxin system ToxN/AbiQ family toxin [Ruminococcus sp.]
MEAIKKAADISTAFFIRCKRRKMEQKRLRLYKIDMKYIRDLAQKDDNVHSVSPQVGKDNRPFVGIIIICDNKKYCIPLSSPKPKHQKMKNDIDFMRINVDGKLLGVLNFNNMIPVDERFLIPVELRITRKDSSENTHYKKMAVKQLNWCQQNQDLIVTKANKLYHIVTETPDKMRMVTKRCCNFKKLEAVLEKRLEKELEQQAPAQNSLASNKSKSQSKAPFSVSKLKSETQRIHNQSRNSTGKNKSHKKDDHSL